jgi:uncharacterized membrane protein YjgN (DUF898 family)
MESGGSGPLPERHNFEFRGSGVEFFRIWILNLALTLATLGVYSAWAKVRTRRYLYGSTSVAGHAFDYSPSPWRILIGRIIALSFFIAYSLTGNFWPQSIPGWYLAFGLGLPWLINSSLRFNARNTSYRNLRFDFVGRYIGALVAYVIWPIVGWTTFGIMLPFARKARDYFYVNHHRYGGRAFETSFSTLSIYLVYLGGIGIFIGLMAAAGAAIIYLLERFKNFEHAPWLPLMAVAVYLPALTIASTFIRTLSFNLSINGTVFDGKHRLASRVSPWIMSWIVITNLILTLATLGLFYPFGRVRLTRYQATRLALIAVSDLDEYTSELGRARSAVGEEIASFFDFGFGL